MWQKIKEEIRKERRSESHGRKCAGIPGLLPLVLGLPVRFTEAINAESRKLGILKHARGVIVSWELRKSEEDRVLSSDDPEITLHQMPVKLLFAVDSTSKELPLRNGKRIFR